jgi:hypothetical protein
MNKKEESRFSMFLAVQAYCLIAEIGLVLNKLKGFTAFFAAFQAVIVKIQTIRTAQEYDYKGAALTKKQIKQLLIKKVMVLIRRLIAYAKAKKDQDMLEAVNYSQSELEACADTVLTDKCRVVTEQTDGIMVELETDYKVTQAMITEINTLRDDFLSDVPKPRLGAVNRSKATTALKLALKEGNDDLKEMDVIVEMLKDSETEGEADVYNGYKGARAIVDAGVRKRKNKPVLMGRVIDFETGLPIAGARVSIVGTTIVVVTLEDGSFAIALKSYGMVQVRAEADGYKVKVEEEVNVAPEMEEVVMEMEKT